MTTIEAGPIDQPAKRPPLIIIVGADKGGVGKTTVSRALIDYLGKLSVPVRAFDTEPGDTGVLKRFYHPAEMLNASTAPGQMRIVDAARADAVTLVDARAGLLGPILKSFHRIDLLADVKRGALVLLVVHVVDSSVAAAGEIPDVIKAMEGAALIRANNRVKPDAEFSPGVPGEVAIEIPNLDEAACRAVDVSNLGFAAFVADPNQSRTLRGYVRAWLADAHAAFDRAGIGAMVR